MDELLDIQRYSEEQQYEAFVAKFAQEIIRRSNKIWSNGYVSVQECPIRHFNVDAEVKRTDVIVYVKRNRKVILIIECKVDQEDFDEGEVQLESYMIETKCRRGILMNAKLAREYEYIPGSRQRPYQVGSDVNLTNVPGIQTLIEFINES
ncbi:hypothetical protein CONCODRAFT_68469 [Conidiobolus coronatus NRRL 28638]|uniref:Type I restriction enzyme R protein N-terminal domain-containing protein n=1 Tax=Conidiobolus coronatus (strain ATCC 28846 / CBS 209.66 / NRRL 28638) TaxID=796925 RepID=A0A137PE16_CONC2|nr:hypothetical protein CONCODRAFT_68469 [Conidiobolus coronatus NRRL 28638]|eukprot:KXN73212.1 hypothetical protein CONCODRAFT_68469 [Conidiobolus coronatus NRRL 28638]